jgi:predicted permease
MRGLVRDLRLGIRMLLKRPGTTGLAATALALGIGLTTTMFSIVDAAFLRGLPFDHGERIVALSRVRPGPNGSDLNVPPDDFLDWKSVQHSFEGLAGTTTFPANISSSGRIAERYRGARMTANTLRLLRVRPAMGRDFTDNDGRADAPPVALISDALWTSRFDRTPDVLGQVLRVNGAAVTIVGVLPPRFGFPDAGDIWVAERIERGAKRGEGRALHVIGRLKPGVSISTAQTEMRTIARQLAQQYPENKDVSADVSPYTRRYLGAQIIAMLSTMLAAVFGVLLIACVNVTNLQLARAADRMKEMAVRVAIGATAWRVVRQLLVEGGILATMGAAAGLAIAAAGVTLFRHAVADTNPPFWMDFRIDVRALLFVMALTVIAALASSLMPALRVARQDINIILKDEGRSSTGFRVGLFSRTLVIVEMTLSFVLLAVSGLMIKSIVTAGAVTFPYETHLMVARFNVPERDYHSAEEARQLFARLRERIAAIPGVQSVAVSTSAPDGGAILPIAVQGEPVAADETKRPRTRTFEVSSGFLDTLRVKTREGRGISDGDRESTEPIAVVTEDLARRHFPNGSAIGRKIQMEKDGPWRTIVGVIPAIGVGLQAGDGYVTQLVLTPITQSESRDAMLLVSAAGAAETIGPEMRRAVMDVDPTLPLFDLNTLSGLYEQRTWPFRVFGGLFMTFGFAALIMSAAGLYGVMSFAVRRRTQEIGVRIALGADRGRITRMVVRQGLWQVGLGIGIGAGLGWLLGSSLQLLLFQVKPGDPMVFGLTIALLALVGLLASYVPAIRAAAVDPITALRHD